MVERIPLGRIQKTSLIALIGLAAATMMITVSMIGAIQLQEASARQATNYCYSDSSGNSFCGFTTRKECNETRRLVDNDRGGCYPAG